MMRKNYFFLIAALFVCISANASVTDTLAFWDFEGEMVDGTLGSIR